ncbi:MAG: glycosyltransferase family 2 protein, partial [Actinomycetota bacterium]|nr:glycosyltransferase family 2 protein [Actinomycetota bacterium]
MATASTSTPPVVAVVVSRNPGSWFRECLEHLAAQDYPSLATLVIDAASTEDPESLVRDVIPDAAVHRLDSNPGYGAAANQAPELVSGAAFYLFLHDDVALAPDAVTRLVEESFRSNAGIAGPKLLDFEEPGRIRSVGNAIDKAGVTAPYAEAGELDQEQHDRVRDVFSVQGGCILIRSDLFATLEGFDAGIDYFGDDLDLCWRAHVVGARVFVVPAATARHREALAERGFPDERRRRLARHRVRTMAKCYGWLDLLLVLPQAFLMAVAEAVLATVTGRFRQAGDVLGAWVWNVVRLRAIMSGRRGLKRLRRVRDRDIRRLQVRGSARLTAFLRGQIGGGSRIQHFTERGRAFAGTLGDGPRRMAIVVWTVLTILFLFGARHLITRDIVPVGQFVAFPDRGALLHSFGSGWNEVELGSSGPAPVGLGLLGLASSVMFGATGLLRQVLILGL